MDGREQGGQCGERWGIISSPYTNIFMATESILAVGWRERLPSEPYLQHSASPPLVQDKNHMHGAQRIIAKIRKKVNKYIKITAGQACWSLGRRHFGAGVLQSLPCGGGS
jgi:hypothetical protein